MELAILWTWMQANTIKCGDKSKLLWMTFFFDFMVYAYGLNHSFASLIKEIVLLKIFEKYSCSKEKNKKDKRID
jgi:hypothetical protein